MKSKIFTTAWNLFRSGAFASFGEALKAAWNKSKLKTALKKGIAYFQFTKKDGTVRTAIGTTANNNFDYESKGTERKENDMVVKFWDVEKRAFRSLTIDSFIGFCA